MSSFESVRFLRSVRFIWFSCFRSFWFHENVIQKTKGRSGQTKKTGFLFLFQLHIKVRLCLTEQTTVWASAFLFESTTEIRPERICRRCAGPSSCRTLTCRCCILNNFFKKSRRSVTCKLATLIWSSSRSFTRQQNYEVKPGKSYTPVVHGLHMLWFKYISSSNFFKLVHIFQTGSYFSNQFIFFKLVHIFQTGLKFLNQFNFQF